MMKLLLRIRAGSKDGTKRGHLRKYLPRPEIVPSEDGQREMTEDWLSAELMIPTNISYDFLWVKTTQHNTTALHAYLLPRRPRERERN